MPPRTRAVVRVDQKKEVNRDIMVAMLDIFISKAFNKQFNILKFSLTAFKKWCVDPNNPVSKILWDLLAEKAVQRAKTNPNTPENIKASSMSVEEVMVEFETRQVAQILTAALALGTYGRTDKRVIYLFKDLFVTRYLAIGFINAASYLQFAVMNMQKKQLSIPIENPFSGEVVFYLHSLLVLDQSIGAKKTSAQRWYHTGNKLGYGIQLVVQAYSNVTRSISETLVGAKLGKAPHAFEPYLLYDKKAGLFKVLENRSDGFTPEAQSTDLNLPEGPNLALHSADGVDKFAWGRSLQIDKALRMLAKLFLEDLSMVATNSSLYEKSFEELTNWDFLHVFRLQGSEIPQRFAKLSEDIAGPLELKLPPVVVPPEVIDLENDPMEITPQAKTPASSSKTTKGNPLQSKRPVGTGRKGVLRAKKYARLGNPVSSNVVKEEDVIETVPALPSTTFSDEVLQAKDLLSKELTQYCVIVPSCFTEFLNVLDIDEGRDIRNQVSLLLCDPPYNTRSEQKKRFSEYDDFGYKDMQAFARLADEVLKPGAHGNIFCSARQFAYWLSSLNMIREEVNDEIKDKDGKDNAEGPPKFTAERIPMVYVRSPGNLNSDPRIKRMEHTSMAEYAIHFWKCGPDHVSLLSMVDYSKAGDVLSDFPGTSNVVTNIPRIQPSDILYREETNENGRPFMWRPEQKSIPMLKDIIVRMTKPGATVVDTFAGTCATAKACLMLKKHRKFIGCDKDEDCLEAAMPELLRVFAEQVLNEDSDIVCAPEVGEAAKVYLHALKGMDRRKRINKWTVPGGLPPAQTMPDYLLEFLSSMHLDYSLLDKNGNIPIHSWSPKWRNRLELMNPRALLATELSALGVAVQKSTIKHKNAGNGLFALRTFGPSTVIGYYYGSLVYSNLAGSPQRYRTYGEGLMRVMVENFETWSMKMEDKVVGKDVVAHDVWIVPAPWCATRYINDARYVEGDLTDRTGLVKPPRVPKKGKDLGSGPYLRVPNVELKMVGPTDSPAELSEYTVCSVSTIREVKRGEEFFTSYGPDYDFKKYTSKRIIG